MSSTDILLINLDFGTWDRAKHLSYPFPLGFEEGFTANGLTFMTLPAVSVQSSFERQGQPTEHFLKHAKSLLGGKTFKQVWIELCHTHVDHDFLEWLKTVAPIRVGFCWESLYYPEAICQVSPHYRERAKLVLDRMAFMTHAVVVDEHDIPALEAIDSLQVKFWTSAIPRTYMDPVPTPAEYNRGGFIGSLYGERQAWLDSPQLQGRVVQERSLEIHTEYPKLFDRLHEITFNEIKNGNVTTRLLDSYLSNVRTIRRNIYSLWLKSLRRNAVVVNLPMFGRSYASRVADGMAVGRPVVTQALENRPLASAAFEDGRDIVLYRTIDELATQMDRLIGDQPYARKIAENALRLMREHHTMERRVAEIVGWANEGVSPSTTTTTTLAVEMTVAPTPAPVAPTTTTKVIESEDEFYTNFFTNNGIWSAPEANEHEIPRWQKIERLLRNALDTQKREGRSTSGAPRLLDLGCGRGWLANLLTQFGSVDGIEPVKNVVLHARKLFPQVTFYWGGAETIAMLPAFVPYDVVVSSEVIEHVPDEHKQKFARDLRQLLKPGGHVIITTPRQEAAEEWRRICGATQPIEDWMTEAGVRSLFEQAGFIPESVERIYIDRRDSRYVTEPSEQEIVTRNLLGLYQVWRFRAPLEDTPGHFVSEPARLNGH